MLTYVATQLQYSHAMKTNRLKEWEYVHLSVLPKEVRKQGKGFGMSEHLRFWHEII